MGAAQSSNVAQATSNVATDISSSTSVNSYQLNNGVTGVNLWHCNILLHGDFNVQAMQNVYLKNSQITNVKNSSSLHNNVQQSVLQNAISKVGSMGVGFAQAINNTSLFCNISNNVIYNVSQASSQFNNQAQTFDCQDSTIVADNLNINFTNSAEFYNKQVLDNTNVTDVTNEISQTVTQKASATVQGLAGFLIGLALVIAALGYTVAKPLTTGPFKMLMAVILVIVLCGIGIWMYLVSAPPFFNSDTTCCPYTNLGACDTECINQTLQTLPIKMAPLRYLFPLTSDITPPPGIAPKVSLFSLAITAAAGPDANNGGYTMQALNNLNTSISNLSDLVKKNPQINSLLPKQPMPPLLVNPATKGMIAIPLQYIMSSGDGTTSQNFVGTCTPGSIAYDPKATGMSTDSNTWQSCYTTAYWETMGQNPATTTDPTMAVANSNATAWNTWLNTDIKVNGAWARFVLIYLLNEHMSAKIDLNSFFDPENEIVRYVDLHKGVLLGTGKIAQNFCQHYQPQDGIMDYVTGTAEPGTITAMVGVCNDNTYKFHQFSRKIGVWIVLIFVALVLLYMIYQYISNKKKGKIPDKP